ncbi:aromatic ring-hydroxylating oxygenase subunit alpha [Bacillus sp. Marseille-P3661]|uniref:aromatic ring-hydroxylating oxygenase subunit alpha n=1 Tax=Bacillus sp. Marseille-P3661 TaxID=1936234 RepID=UPI000C849B43|nr:aromatic ring-hydroxylating dioxygenase subunit alpha [Bacillus sp. Marseille-P3661]
MNRISENPVLEEMSSKLKEGLVSNMIYHDQDIFELEQEKIFSKTWVFVAHDTEIPNKGDFVVRYVVQDSFIVVRGKDNQIGVYFNYCTHRGMHVCRAEDGNTSSFRCHYHGWNFNTSGELIGVPFEEPIYGESMDRKDFGLIAPRFGVYKGMIFVCLDDKAPSLEEYLGDFKWYLDLVLNWSPNGMEVTGPPQRWIVETNWKIPSENIVGDSYHTPISHKSAMEVGLANIQKAKDALPGSQKDGAEICAGSGNVGFRMVPSGSFWGYPKELIDSLKMNVTPEQFKLIEDGYFPFRGHIFPNLSFLNTATYVREDQVISNFLTFRVWQPLGPDKIEIISWSFVPKGAPNEFKDYSKKAYIATFGTSGMYEVDDAENWLSITRNTRGKNVRNFYQNIKMGMDTDKILPDWPGPGIPYSSVYTEAGQRYFLNKWLGYMTSK